MNFSQLAAVILKVGEAVEANREYLTDLDRAIGDADHGINMSKGFRAVAEKVAPLAAAQAAPAAGEPGAANSEPAALLKTVGMTLISTVGGASGPLYGTAFLRAGMAVAGRTELRDGDLLAALEAALGGIRDRGKAVMGDKTIVDALEPAVHALRETLTVGETAAVAATRAAAAAEQGAAATCQLVARKGRASYLGERSLGHQDPGATSTAIMLGALASALTGRGGGN